MDLHNQAGKGISELSCEYGIPKGTVSTWIKNLSPVKVSETETISIKEYKALQKRWKSLKSKMKYYTKGGQSQKSYCHIRQKSIAEYVSFIQTYRNKMDLYDRKIIGWSYGKNITV